MTITFFVPAPLRRFTEGKERVDVETPGPTLREGLDDLWRLHPGVRDRILTEQGGVREHINLFVGDRHIRETGGLDTPLSDRARIHFLTAVSGGGIFPHESQTVGT